MFVDEIERAVEAAPRSSLPEVARQLWRAYADGHMSEEMADRLSRRIEVRKALPAAPVASGRGRAGSRPRTTESMVRRRRWASMGFLPPQISARFTLAEMSVLAVVAAEFRRHGACTLTIGHLAAVAGVSETTVRNALRVPVEGRHCKIVCTSAEVRCPRQNAGCTLSFEHSWTSFLLRTCGASRRWTGFWL